MQYDIGYSGLTAPKFLPGSFSNLKNKNIKQMNISRKYFLRIRQKIETDLCGKAEETYVNISQ